jgi:hypothetical protein
MQFTSEIGVGTTVEIMLPIDQRNHTVKRNTE